MESIVVVGASRAGLHAVETLRENGFRGSITFVGEEHEAPYDRPPLIAATAFRNQPTVALRPPSWYSDRAVSLELGQAAIALDPDRREVVLTSGRRLGFDGLVIATGSCAKVNVRGAEHVLPVRRAAQAGAVARHVQPLSRVAIIGAGFLGLELAATLTLNGCVVDVVEVAPVPLSRVLGDEVGSWFLDLHQRNGVRIECQVLATAVERSRGGFEVHLQDGSSIISDLVIGAMGVSPAVEWLEGSGAALADGVLCDETLRTSLPGVVAAGDVARWYNPIFDEVMRVEQWSNAVEQGRHAALSLLGGSNAFASIPYLWSDQFDARMRFVGVTNAAADVEIKSRTSGTLDVCFVRDGVQIGGLCVNTTMKELKHHRDRIARRAPAAACR